MKLKLFLLILSLFLPLSALANPGAMMLQMGGLVASVGAWFGTEVLSRVDQTGENETIIDLAYTSSVSGEVTSISIYSHDIVTGVEFACFEDTGSNVYQTDGAGKTVQSSGAVNISAGLNTLSGGTDFTSFDCNSGEYLGFYVPSSGGYGIDYDNNGSAGMTYYSGDAIPTNGATFTYVANLQYSIQFYVE